MALLAGLVYYLDTEHDTFAEPKQQIIGKWESFKAKVDEKTDIKIKKNTQSFALSIPDLSDRLTSAELNEYKMITQSKQRFDEFRQQECNRARHNVFSRENLRFICDLPL